MNEILRFLSKQDDKREIIISFEKSNIQLSMKNLILLTFIMLFSAKLFAQDVIILKDGTEIKAKVLKVGISEIDFKKFENIDGPQYTMTKGQIFMIKYENGTKDVFNKVETTDNVEDVNQMADTSLFTKGKNDANKNYHTEGGGVTCLVSAIDPIIGLIPAIMYTSNPPTMEKLNYQNPTLIKNSNYYNGYVQRASKMQRSSVWAGWFFGTIIDVAVIVILTSHH